MPVRSDRAQDRATVTHDHPRAPYGGHPESWTSRPFRCTPVRGSWPVRRYRRWVMLFARHVAIVAHYRPGMIPCPGYCEALLPV